MRRSCHLAVSAAILLLLAAAVPGARAEAGETEHEEEFSYALDKDNGPKHWGSIKKDWATCDKGRMQSPIDLSQDRVSLVRSASYLNHSYRAADAFIVNRGHDIMVKFDGDAGSVLINGTKYDLRQMHWHSPSEHTVKGRRYEMEMHLVHQSADKKHTAVIGLLYEVGSPDEFLRKMEPFLKRIADKKDKEEKLGVLDPRGVSGKDSVYYRYIGSLTTPPCTEGVIWSIVTTPRTVSKDQVELLRKAVHDDAEGNERPLQKLNDRNISLFETNPRRL